MPTVTHKAAQAAGFKFAEAPSGYGELQEVTSCHRMLSNRDHTALDRGTPGGGAKVFDEVANLRPSFGLQAAVALRAPASGTLA